MFSLQKLNTLYWKHFVTKFKKKDKNILKQVIHHSAIRDKQYLKLKSNVLIDFGKK